MAERAGLTFRSGYLGYAAGWRALADLLEETFGIDVTVLDRFGGPDPTSVPFAWFDAAGACVANITAFSLPLVVNGAVVNAAGLQSGAVRPEYRGRGLYRDVMEAALRHCDAAGFEAVALLTDTPDLYTRHGFRPFAQHRFVGPSPAGGHAAPTRRLDIGNAADAALLAARLDTRQPVSTRFAPLRQREMFLFNALLTPGLRLDLIGEAIVAWRMGEDGRFELLDIVAPAIPRLADILASLKIVASQTVVHFAPDRLDWTGVPVVDVDGMVFMLCAPQTLQPSHPFALPPPAEF